MRYVFARVIILHKDLAVNREAVQIIEDVYLTSRRVLGPSHPMTNIDATFGFRSGTTAAGPDGEVLSSWSDVSGLRFDHIVSC